MIFLAHLLQQYALLEVLYDMLGRSQVPIVIFHIVQRIFRLLIKVAKHLLVQLYLKIRTNIDAKVLEAAAPICLPPLVFPLVHGPG